MPRGSLIQQHLITGALVFGALSILSPAQADGQDSIPWPAANRLTVDVAVRDVTMRGDTVRVRYQLTSAPASEQRGDLFAVRSSGVVLGVSAPLGWRASYGILRDSGAVHWSSMVGQSDLAPGASLDGFAFEGLGALDIVSFLVQGDYSPPKVTESTEDLIMVPPSVWVNAFRGKTVGVEPLPTDLSPGNLLARLRALTDSACSLGWINGRGICRELAAHLDQVNRELQRGRREEARGHLREFVRDLRERSGRRPGEGERGDDERGEREDRDDRGAAVNSSAYWLLSVNAQYVLTQLCESGGRCREDR